MSKTELLLRLWSEAEAWRKRKVDTAGRHDWWAPDEAKMVDTLDKLREVAVHNEQKFTPPLPPPIRTSDKLPPRA